MYSVKLFRIVTMNPPYTGKYPNKTGKTFKKEM
jgi:hypothetical protein